MYRRTVSEDWDFRKANTKEYTHTYHSYPAMMIPQIARKLIEDYRPSGRFQLVFDPYMGSGTTLVEAKINGVRSIGTDINPLARLIAEAKITTYDIEAIESRLNELNELIDNYTPTSNLDFNHITNYNFWYSQDSLSKLSYIDNLVETTNDNVKVFFKIALSECIREVSYTRNGEFKRYRIEKEKIADYKPDPFPLFFKKINRNLNGLKEFTVNSKDVEATTYDFNTVHGIDNSIIQNGDVDLVVTSPPYGDSKTTVAYGQYSRWANEWFKFPNAKKMDAILMGGTKISEFTYQTESILSVLEEIKNIDLKRYNEVRFFLDEYYRSMINVSDLVRRGGRVCYVVGNRTVKGVQIPLDFFTVETFIRAGFVHIDTMVRNIPNKRMPSKNSPTNKTGVKVSTMVSEYIVIMEKL